MKVDNNRRIEKFVAQVKAQMLAHERLSKELSVDLEVGRIVFGQLPESTKSDYRTSLLFGIVWAIIIPIVLYDKRESLPCVWILSVSLSLWWCYGAFIKKELQVDRIIYFDVDVAQKTIRVPRPSPYHSTSSEVIEMKRIEQFMVLKEESGFGINEGWLVALVNEKEVPILQDSRFNRADLVKIAEWLTSLWGKMTLI